VSQVGLYARGLSTRDIRAHLREIYNVEVSPDLISRGHRRGTRGADRLAGPAAGPGADSIGRCESLEDDQQAQDRLAEQDNRVTAEDLALLARRYPVDVCITWRRR